MLKRFKFKSKGSSALSNPGFPASIKKALSDTAFLGKLRNALVIFFAIMAVFRVGSSIAGRHLSGYSYASFIAYFSFFMLVGGGLLLSVYFPAAYSGQKRGITIKLPQFSRQKQPKSEKELSSMLKQERKNLVRVTREKESAERNLERMKQKLEKAKKEKEELRSAAREAPARKKVNYGSMLASLLPKKEVVGKERGRTEMPETRTSPAGRKLSGKYKSMPKQQQQRTELYRNIARSIQKEDGSFTISQVMEALLELFRPEVDSDRRKFVEELEGWVNEDAYTPLMRNEKGVKHYRIIK